MTLKRIAVIFGAILVLVGILGFIPGITTSAPGDDYGRLFGLFAVDTFHNLVHIVTGVIAIACGMASDAASQTYFKVFGVIYAIVAVLGFFYGRAPLMGTMMANNLPDAALHTVIAAVALVLGFGHVAERLEHRHDRHHPA